MSQPQKFKLALIKITDVPEWNHRRALWLALVSVTICAAFLTP